MDRPIRGHIRDEVGGARDARVPSSRSSTAPHAPLETKQEELERRLNELSADVAALALAVQLFAEAVANKLVPRG